MNSLYYGRKTAIITICVFVIYFMLENLLYMVFATAGYSIETIMTLSNVLALIISLVLIYLTRDYLVTCFKKFNKRYILYVILAYVLYLFIVTGSTIFVEQLMGRTIGESENQIIVQELISRTSLINSFILMAIFTPIIEEIVFRSSIIFLIEGKNPTKLKGIIASLISVLIFSFLHTSTELISLQNFGDVLTVTLPYLVMGTMMVALFRYAKNNVFISMIFHFLFNGIAIFILFFII